eukprot:4208987-Alexandrium_andersonii.AAC.1
MIDAVGPAAGQSIDGISTSDESRSLARAGPCPGFQSLKTLQEMFTDNVMFRSCKSMEDIKKLQQESVQPRKKQLNTLMPSCNAAVSGLLNAQTAAAAAETARAKAAQEKAKRTE